MTVYTMMNFQLSPPILLSTYCYSGCQILLRQTAHYVKKKKYYKRDAENPPERFSLHQSL